MSNLQEIITRGLLPLQVTTGGDFITWASENYYLAPQSSGNQGAYVQYPWQRGIMHALADDDILQFSRQNSAQIGGTNIISSFLLYNLIKLRRSTGLWQPTTTQAEGYCMEEIESLYQYMPAFVNALTQDIDKPSAKNSKRYKEMVGAALYLRGGKASSEYRRV
jgi:phage terminase large subunit GpA-like protein